MDSAIEEHLKARSDFGFESTYSGHSRPGIVRRSKADGYEVAAVFIGTHRPEINIDRVKARVADRTGHGVPDSEVRRRWTAAQDNLIGTSEAIDEVQLIDNSGGRAQRVVTVRKDQSEEIPGWVADLRKRIERRRGTRGGVGGPNAR